jgi:hypothetical protein
MRSVCTVKAVADIASPRCCCPVVLPILFLSSTITVFASESRRRRCRAGPLPLAQAATTGCAASLFPFPSCPSPWPLYRSLSVWPAGPFTLGLAQASGFRLQASSFCAGGQTLAPDGGWFALLALLHAARSCSLLGGRSLWAVCAVSCNASSALVRRITSTVLGDLLTTGTRPNESSSCSPGRAGVQAMVPPPTPPSIVSLSRLEPLRFSLSSRLSLSLSLFLAVFFLPQPCCPGPDKELPAIVILPWRGFAGRSIARPSLARVPLPSCAGLVQPIIARRAGSSIASRDSTATLSARPIRLLSKTSRSQATACEGSAAIALQGSAVRASCYPTYPGAAAPCCCYPRLLSYRQHRQHQVPTGLTPDSDRST